MLIAFAAVVLVPGRVRHDGGMARTTSAASRHIGATIRAIRERQDVTVDKLAVAAEVDSSNMRAYENGRSTPGLRTLIRIAVALDVEPGALLHGVTPGMFDQDG